MSSLQSLRELISERLAAAAEEIFRLCEGTIVQYEQELCRQRRLLDICWKPQLQLHHIVLPQHWLTEEDLCNQQRNFRVDQENPEPPQTPEELQDPEPSSMKEEPGELCISQDEEQLDLKQETETLMEIPTFEEHVESEADGNNQQSFNGTESQDEEGNQHEESTSTPDEETEPQNRDQRKRRDRSHVQSVASSHISEGSCGLRVDWTGLCVTQVPLPSSLHPWPAASAWTAGPLGVTTLARHWTWKCCCVNPRSRKTSQPKLTLNRASAICVLFYVSGDKQRARDFLALPLLSDQLLLYLY